MDIARELGEGIRRMFEHMQGAGLADPVYQQSSMGVKLTLLDQPLSPVLRETLSEKALGLLATLQEARRPLSTAQVADAAGMSRPTTARLLKQLRDIQLVTWSGKSQNDPHATWSVK